MENKKKSYLNAFQHLQANGAQYFTLIGDNIIVEEVAKEELKTASGIIIASSDKHRQVNTVEDARPLLVRVLLVGQGYYDDVTGESQSLGVNPGDILLVGKLGVKWLSSFGPLTLQEGGLMIGLIREAEIQQIFSGEEGYQACGRLLLEGLSL